MHARIIISFIFTYYQITSVRKVFRLFGPPVSDIVASFAEGVENPLLSEEYCHVISNSDWLLEVTPEDQPFRGELFFTVRGHGLEEDGISGLASNCLFSALANHRSSFRNILPRNIADAPVVWTITHSAYFTQVIVLVNRYMKL